MHPPTRPLDLLPWLDNLMGSGSSGAKPAGGQIVNSSSRKYRSEGGVDATEDKTRFSADEFPGQISEGVKRFV
jgi:hypothetical protein